MPPQNAPNYTITVTEVEPNEDIMNGENENMIISQLLNFFFLVLHVVAFVGLTCSTVSVSGVAPAQHAGTRKQLSFFATAVVKIHAPPYIIRFTMVCKVLKNYLSSLT